MRERRHLARKLANERIQVRDINADQFLGQVVNLSNDGLMSIGPKAIESNLILQLELRFQRPRSGQTRLMLGAESLWCCTANEPGHYWTGYQIIDISLRAAEILDILIEDWTIEAE